MLIFIECGLEPDLVISIGLELDNNDLQQVQGYFVVSQMGYFTCVSFLI